jgi:hypothetical protein
VLGAIRQRVFFNNGQSYPFSLKESDGRALTEFFFVRNLPATLREHDVELKELIFA